MKYYLIGSNSRLGHAIKSIYLDENVVSLKKEVYQDWSDPLATENVIDFFQQSIEKDSVIFVVSGLIDPNLNYEDLLKVNYYLPKNIIRAGIESGIKIVTFGTVMENFPDSENKYVQSKVVLNKYVADIVKDREMVIHIQLHTLYGIGLPSSFMFLGQILSSLKSNSIFEMTSGHQLREYHHVEDAAFAIREITGSSINGVMHLSHGQPIELGELAEYIFLHFGKLSLLKKGALPDPYADNFNLSYQVNPVIKNVNFRDSVSSIVAYLNDCI